MKLRVSEQGYASFWCPGCEEGHSIRVTIGGKKLLPDPVWTWNGSVEAPTVTPSVCVSGTEFTEQGKKDYAMWVAAGCPKDGLGEIDSRPVCCHSFITDGKIIFLGDCTHALKGQTVPLPEWEARHDVGSC